MRIPGKLSIWVAALRLPYFITSLLPPCLALCLFWKNESPLPPGTGPAFFLLLAGTLCMHGATNLFNDYYDTINGVDNPESVGGSRVVLNGWLKLADLKAAGLFCYLFSLIFFVALSLLTARILILPGWLLGFAISFFYVGPPVAYGYLGWGEAGSFIGMGWVLLLGSYFSLSGHFSWPAFWLASILGLMTAEVLFFQSLPQIETDPRYNKHTLASRLGRRRCFLIQSLAWPFIWLACALLALGGHIGWAALSCLSAIPLYIKSQIQLHKWFDGASPQALYDAGGLIRGMFFITAAALFISILW